MMFRVMFRLHNVIPGERGGRVRTWWECRSDGSISVVPMDLLNGRLSAEAHRRLVQSAAEGRMNTLRIWGGGTYMPRAFYDACDEFGILLYHDLQFTGKAECVLTQSIYDSSLMILH